MADVDTKIDRGKTLAVEVGDRLRTAILDGTIKPGEQIVVAELERRFGVSHIPIREAIRYLEAEGLVETLPKRKTVATGLDLEDLTGLYDLRRLLEGQVAARAVERRTPAELAELLDAHRRLEKLESSSGTEAEDFWTVHREFHWAILAPGATPWIRQTVERLWQSADRYLQLHAHARLGPTRESIRQHRLLTEACERGIPAEVQNALCEHLSTTENQIRHGYLSMADKDGCPPPNGDEAERSDTSHRRPTAVAASSVSAGPTEVSRR